MDSAGGKQGGCCRKKGGQERGHLAQKRSCGGGNKTRVPRRRVWLGRSRAGSRAWMRLEGSMELGQGARPSRSHFAKLALSLPLLRPSLCLAAAGHGGPKTNPLLLEGDMQSFFIPGAVVLYMSLNLE